ncbi:MAG TPA: hypothetical protein VGJ53_06640 [Micromonosporaceae bacterium]
MTEQPPPTNPDRPPYVPPGADPWSAQPTVIEFGAPVSTDDGRPRRRRTTILLSIGVVVALLLGGAAFAGVRLWNGSGPQPEEAVPASVAAFARLDLSPGLGHGLKLNALLRKFPKSTGGEDAIDQLKAGLFGAVDIDEADYHAHVEPWFADRFGLAVWQDKADRPYLLAAIASSDDRRAANELKALQGKRGANKFGFAVDDRWALVAVGDTSSQDAAASAAAQANAAPLAAADTFRDAVAPLPGHQPLLGWADLGRVAAVFVGAMRSGMTVGGSEPPDLEALTGRIVLAGQATDNGIEVRMRASGLSQPAPAVKATDALARLGEQPANSAVAAAIGLPEFGDTGLPGIGQFLGGPELADLPPDVAAELAKDPEYAKAQAEFKAVSEAMRALSGASLTFALTDATTPELRAVAELTGTDLAASLTKALRNVGDEVTVTRDGARVELRTRGYAPQGKLSESATYRETMAGMSSGAIAAVYLDIQRLAEQGGASEQERREIAPLKSVGLVSGHEGPDTVAMLRVVIK